MCLVDLYPIISYARNIDPNRFIQLPLNRRRILISSWESGLLRRRILDSLLRRSCFEHSRLLNLSSARFCAFANSLAVMIGEIAPGFTTHSLRNLRLGGL